MKMIDRRTASIVFILTVGVLFWLQALSRLYEEAVSVTGKGRNKLQLAIEQLLQCVRNPNCPSYMAKVLLRALQNVNGEV